MKKIATVVAVIIAFAVVGFVCWRYFDKNFKDYQVIAEKDVLRGDEYYFLGSALVQFSGESLTVYSISDDRLAEIYSENKNRFEVVFSSADYIVAFNGNSYDIYTVSDGQFVRSTALPSDGRFVSAHQFSKTLYIKMLESGKETVIYGYSAENGIRNITDTQDFGFSDYCYDEANGNEYFISYDVSGEFVKLIIRMYNGGTQIKRIELDNIVYNGFDYINNLFVFYTDNSLLMINTQTLVRRERYCYDIDSLQKFVYSNKIVYYWQNAYFDGIHNVFTINEETDSFASLKDCEYVTSYGNNLIYSDGQHIRQYSSASSLLDESILYTESGVSGLGVMDNVIAVIKSDKIIFIKNQER